MTDLSLKGARQFWYEYHDPMVYKVLTFMEGVENWTLDGDPELEEALNRLGEMLEEIGGVDLKNEEAFIKVVAYIKSTRNLRLLQALDTAHPGAASKLLMHAETTAHQNEVSEFFLKRNIAFERLRLLSRIFAPERVALVKKVLEE